MLIIPETLVGCYRLCVGGVRRPERGPEAGQDPEGAALQRRRRPRRLRLRHRGRNHLQGGGRHQRQQDRTGRKST